MQLLAFGNVFVALFAVEVCVVIARHKFRREIGFAAYACILFGLAVARATYVVQWWAGYRTDPMSMFNILDGGWNALAGWIAALLLAAALALRDRSVRIAIPLTFAASAAVYLAGTLVGHLATDGHVAAKRLPSVGLISLEGVQVQLHSFIGKPTIVNLWASWCGPCRRELPTLRRVQAANPDINVVFVNAGEAPDTVNRFLREAAIHPSNVLLDPLGRVPLAFNRSSIPVTFFFDRNGILTDTRVGELSAGALTARLSNTPAQ